MTVKTTNIRKSLASGLMLAALSLAATPAMALTEIYLAAKEFSMPMPGGNPAVTMWGFASDPGGTCYNTTPASARVSCVAGLTATVPGPRLDIPTGEDDVRIFLTNALPEQVSIVIPGQEMARRGAANRGPTWDDGSIGARPGPAARVRSFGREAGANGGRRVYRWTSLGGAALQNPLQPGTYLYQSGTHPQLQVQMGLYGAVRHDVAAGEAYTGINYDSQRDLFYSEVDPALHNPPTAANTTNYNPKYFLLQSYDATGAVEDVSIDPTSSTCIDDGATTDDAVLLRLYNVGLQEIAPTMIGSHFDLVAEGGKKYQFPRNQYSVLLPPGSTKDVVFTPGYGGTFSLIERRLNITDPGATGSVTGGMQTCFNVAAVGGTNDPPTVSAGGPYTGTAGITIQFDGMASDPDNDPLTLTWDFDDGNFGTGLSPSHTYAAAGTYNPTLTADDGTNPPVTSSAATVSVAANVSPTAEANGPYDARAIGFFPSQTITAIDFSSAGSSDPEGQGLTYSWDFDASDGIQVDSTEANPTHTYGSDGTFTVTLTVSDGVSAPGADTATATVTQNAQPVAVVTAPASSVSVTVTIEGCSSSDGNGDALTYTWDFADGSGIQVTTDPTCSVVHTFPTETADTTYTVTLVVNDGFEDSAAALTDVTILGTAGNDAPVAIPDAFNPNEIAGTASIAAPGVIVNDTDDGNPTPPGTLTAVLVPGSVNEQLRNLVLNADGSFTYTPREKVGDFTFQYTANDSLLNSAPATVTVTREIWVDKAEYKESKAQWNIKGKSSQTGGTVTIYLGATTGGTVLTTFTVGGDTKWGGKVSGLAPPGATNSISVDNTATTDGAVLNRTVVLK